MREDFHKIVIEKPRHNSDLPSKKWGWATTQYDPDKHDDQPTRVSSSRQRQYGFAARTFTDVLSPLERFLKGAVGRPWNDVYSEIKAALDSTTVTGRHIIDHVWGFVERECYEHRGRVLRVGYGREVTGLYIHPRTGVLCYTPRESKAALKAKYNKPDPNTRKIGPLEFHKRLDGVWYAVKLVRYDVYAFTYRAALRFDKDGKGDDRGAYIIGKKRQLNSKEIRRHSLNAPPA